jgi:DNA-directed RNA polymerase specialized sigma24 family protein
MNQAFPAPVLVDVRDTTVRADVARLEEVYEEHGARLWRALFLYAGDREVASDAVAEAFAQALRRGDDLRSPERWIWRIAFRIAMGELSRRRRQTEEVMATSYEVPEETTELLLALPELHGESAGRNRSALLLRLLAERGGEDHGIDTLGGGCPPPQGAQAPPRALGRRRCLT